MSYLIPILCPCLFVCLLFSSLCSMQGSQFPDQGLNLVLHCKGRILTTGPPWKSPVVPVLILNLQVDLLFVGLSLPALRVTTSHSVVLYCPLPLSVLQSARRCIKQVWSERDDSLQNLLAILYSLALLISLPPTQSPSQESWQFTWTLFFPFVLPVLLFPPYLHVSPFIFSLPVLSSVYHQAALRLKRLPAELPSQNKILISCLVEKLLNSIFLACVSGHIP